MSFNCDPRHFHITFNHNWQSDLMKFPKRLKAGVSKTIEIMCSCIFLLSANSSYSLLIYMSFNCHPCHFYLTFNQNWKQKSRKHWKLTEKVESAPAFENRLSVYYTHTLYVSLFHTQTHSSCPSFPHTHTLSISLFHTHIHTHTLYLSISRTHTQSLSLFLPCLGLGFREPSYPDPNLGMVNPRTLISNARHRQILMPQPQPAYPSPTKNLGPVIWWSGWVFDV